MSGLEIAGLALAIFPVVIQIISSCHGILTTCDTDRLLECLRTNEAIFRNSIELLLWSIVPATELAVLLHDLQGVAWKDESLKDRFDSLGKDSVIILDSTADIYKTLSRLKGKLVARDVNTSPAHFAKRSRRIVKNFFSGPLDNASLERLTARIRDFETLTTGTAKLVSSRKKLNNGLHDLILIRDCAGGLHNALQAGLMCDCDNDEPHPANIKLDKWSLNIGSNSVKFSFMCAIDARHTQQEHYMTAETIVSLTTHISSSPSGSSAPDPVNNLCNLCSVLKPPMPAGPVAPRRRHGSISDSRGRDYSLSDGAQPPTTHNSGKVRDFFESNHGLEALTRRARVQLALQLAWAVLQMSYTGWLEGKWTKENVLVVLATPDDALAYISHEFQSVRQQPRSPTLAPTSEDLTADWTSNPSLFALGIFMLEVCYNKSIEELAIEKEKVDLAVQPILTAKRLLKIVHYDFGTIYADAVRASLDPPFMIPRNGEGKPKDYAQFANDVYQRIIRPLKAVAKIYGISDEICNAEKKCMPLM